MPANQPQLKNVKPRCRNGPLHYPVKCRFTATEVAPGSQKTIRMAGTITVTGASSDGKNFEYGLNYAPTH